MVRNAGHIAGLDETPPASDEVGATLLQRIANKDRKAFESFYYSYTPRIGSFMMKLLKNPELVDEAINDFMLTVWQSADKFDPSVGKLSTWLFGIAHNKALKVLERQRRQWREETIVVDEHESTEHEWDEIAAETVELADVHNPEQTVLGWELGDILVSAMDRLSPEHRIVLELVFTESYSYDETAEIIGCPVNTVKTRIFHARKKLADLLSKRGYSPYNLQEKH